MVRRRLGVLAATTALAAGLSGCVIESPSVAPTDAATGPAATAAAATPTPAVPTPTPQPTATPEPVATATPIPTATPQPTPTVVRPTPLPTIVAEVDSVPTTRPAGLVVVPVNGEIAFRLSEPHPILQIAGHTLIYVDDGLQAEVDIFTPVANAAGNVLATFDDVIVELTTSPTFAGLTRGASTTVAGLRAEVFEGAPVFGERGFFTDLTTLDDEVTGWYPPVRLRLYLIDTPTGPVAFTVESLEDPGQFADAERLADDILATIDFN